MTVSERIAANARFLCRSQGKKISEMEAAVGVSTGYLSRIKGKETLRVDVSYALAEYLGVSLSDLIKPNLAKEARIAKLKAELDELEKEEEDA